MVNTILSPWNICTELSDSFDLSLYSETQFSFTHVSKGITSLDEIMGT
jgi:hypothetical protein